MQIVRQSFLLTKVLVLMIGCWTGTNTAAEPVTQANPPAGKPQTVSSESQDDTKQAMDETTDTAAPWQTPAGFSLMMVQKISDPSQKRVAKMRLLNAFAAAGDFRRAAEVAKGDERPSGLRAAAAIRVFELLDEGDVAQAVKEMEMVSRTSTAKTRASGFALIALDRAEAGEIEQALTFWRRALESVEGTEDASEKLNALLSITSTMRRSQKDQVSPIPNKATEQVPAILKQAMVLSRQIEEGPQKDSALASIGSGLAYAGDMAAALEVAQKVGDNRQKEEVLASIASCFANAGNLSKAFEVAQKCEESGGKDQALASIGFILADAGNIAKALDVAQRIRLEYHKVSVLRHIATEQAKAGDLTGALENLKQSVNAANLTALGHMAGEEGVDFAAAMMTVASALKRPEEFEQVLELANKIENPRTRAIALSGISSAQSKLRDTEEAAVTLNHALEACQKVENVRTQQSILMAMVVGKAETGEIDHALSVAQSVEDVVWKASALQTIAVTFATEPTNRTWLPRRMKTAFTPAEQQQSKQIAMAYAELSAMPAK